MARIISAQRVATLLGTAFLGESTPRYAGLAGALRLLIGDGRIPLDTRLPSERDLTDALGISRTTVTRAYAELRERGYAEARRGSGTFTRIPGGRRAVTDRTLAPRASHLHGIGDGDRDEGASVIDLNCAAPSAPPGLAAAYDQALADLPAYLSGHGYYPAGLPELQQAIAATYEARDLPTNPDQIMVTPGALSASAIVAHAFTAPGDRALVENPTYPNATQAIGHRGARLVPAPVDPDGWDLDALAALIRQAAPSIAYLIPDFHNPTGHLMIDAHREEYASALGRARALAVVDEAHQPLALDGQTMPRPFAAYAADAITIGSASKHLWGGLRLGWIRAPEVRMPALMQARLTLDLGTPVFEQLVLAHLLREPGRVLEANRQRLREQRDHLAGALAAHLPDWRFRLPGGGLALWCELPEALASVTTEEAEQHGVVIAPGPVFAVEGGFERFVRIPWTRPTDELEEAVTRLAAAWAAVGAGASSSPRRRITVA